MTIGTSVAKLPAPEDYGLTAPRAARSVTEIAPTREAPDLDTGKVMMGLGEMMQKEAEKLDMVVATDALNQLQTQQMELTYGDQGFTKILGGEVVKRPVTKEYQDKVKRLTDGLASGIGSAAARTKFLAAAADANRGFTQRLYLHTATQTDKYMVDTASARIDLAAKAAKNGEVQSGLNMAIPVVDSEIARRGLTGDAATVFRQEALGVVHAGAIDGLLARGDTSAASLYLKVNKESMSKKQVDHYDPIVKAQNAYVTGTALGDETLNMSPTDAQRYITEKAAGDKAVADAAHAQRARNDKAIDDASKETKGALVSQFSQKPSATTAQQIYSSPQFLALPASEQGTLREYFRHQVQSAEDHARGLSDRAEAKARARWDENPEAIALFSELASNPDLGRLSTGQIYSYAPYIGPKLVGTLEGIRRSRSVEGQKFDIPNDMIKEALPINLQSAKTEKEKQQVAAFKGIVARTLQDWKDANPGKVPSPSEQYAIVRSGAKEVQQVGLWYGTNTVGAYELRPMPADFRQQAKAAAARRGVALSETQLLDLWAKQRGSR